MRDIRIRGNLPSSIAEGSGPNDWAGGLNLAGDLAGLTEVITIGRDAAIFAAQYDATLKFLRLQPAGVIDAEAMLAGGRALLLNFGLQFRFSDGTVQSTPAGLFGVAVANLDDTPPEALRFLTGGRVAVDALGASIGRLAVTDVDTAAGGFTFTLYGDDDWKFEVVGDELRLRSGINLGWDALGTYSLMVGVSDGRQSAAFMLNIQVTDALNPAPPTHLTLAPGQQQAGFSYVGESSVAAMRGAADVAVALTHTGGLRQLALHDGDQVLLDGSVTRLRFAEGFLEFGPDAVGMRAAALREALGAPRDAVAFGREVAALESGGGWAAYARDLLPSGLGDGAFVTRLWRGLEGRAPTAAERADLLNRLASGTDRAQLAVDLALAPDAMERYAAEHAEGLWVYSPLGGAALGDPGGLIGTQAPAPSPDLFLL